ncbi:M28 family peptidase [Sandarakinorhabdus sp. AAP62]|uniref:M28 family peptidase n=1 Tax=Sandarakinorhabdus sp. AAP62 TaxID=1248916 RepID=UPI0002ED475E|nr:M28 family peptidase [Sandarakinorhabdus sp. AAP62]
MRQPMISLALLGLLAATTGQAQTASPAGRIETAAKLRDAALADNKAWALLSDLTDTVGPRLAASEAEARGRVWAKTALQKLGFVNIREEAFPMTAWERGTASASIVGSNHALAITALGTSGATPKGGLTAPVSCFDNLAAMRAAPVSEVKGRIVFIDHRMTITQDGSSYGVNGGVRRIGPALAAQKGAAAVMIRSLATDYHRNPHTGSTGFPAGVTPIPAVALALPDAELLARRCAAGPVTVQLISTPVSKPGQSANVSAEIPGTVPGEIVVLGGHLDSWDLGHGVFDDGAGVAITMAAAAAIKSHVDRTGQAPRRTIRIVLWGAEEFGVIGGRAYAAAHAAENIVLAGESDAGADRIYNVGSRVAETGLPLFGEIGALLAPLGVQPDSSNKSGGGADVGPLAALGAGVLDLGQDMTRYFDVHHTPDDTLDKVDRKQLDQNVAAWTAAIWLAATDDRPLRTK